jgi:hypothetical protein
MRAHTHIHLGCIFFEILEIQGLTVNGTDMGAYLKSIPFIFYGWTTLLVVLLVILGIIPALVPIKKHLKLVEEKGQVFPDGEAYEKLNQKALEQQDLNEDVDKTKARPYHFLLPMLAMIVVTIASGIDVLKGVIVAVILAFVMNVPTKRITFAEFCTASYEGMNYKRAGINLALGTDTFPPDIFQNIRTATMLSRLVEKGDIEDARFADIYRAATLGGAKFLGRDDLGRLAPGAKADIIFIDLGDFSTGAIEDPIRSMFLSASGRDVKMSIINGRTVMKDRIIPGVDLKELKLKGQEYFNKMKSGYPLRDYQGLPLEQLFRPSFKTV